MDVSTNQDESKLRTIMPLVERLDWPLPVIKPEIKEEIIEDWDEQEYNICPVKEETSCEEDSLSVNTDQISERVVKNEVEEEEEQWDEQEYEFSFSQGVTDEKDPLAFESEKSCDEEERDTYDSLAPVKTEVEEMKGISSDAGDSSNKRLVFPCNRCKKTYYSSQYLKIHYQICRGAREPALKVKPEEVSTDLQSFIRVIRGLKTYCCQLCEYTRKDRAQFKVHLASHTTDRPHKCPQCNRTFARVNCLTRHRRTHIGDRRHQCKQCDKAFNTSSHLKSHMTTHTGERRFACTVCEYKAAFKHSLLSHMRAHTGERPYSCTHCDHKAARSCDLKTHIQAKHTKEKRHSCTKCDYRTTHSTNLKTHIRWKHTNERPFSCAHCDFMTCLKSSLNRHMKNKHVDKSI